MAYGLFMVLWYLLHISWFVILCGDYGRFFVILIIFHTYDVIFHKYVSLPEGKLMID